MTKIITIQFEVDDDTNEEQFIEAITQHVHESNFGGSDTELGALIEGIINIGGE